MTKSGLKKLIGVMFGLRCRQAWYTSNDSSAGGDERRRKGFSEHICRLPWAHEGHHLRNPVNVNTRSGEREHGFRRT